MNAASHMTLIRKLIDAHLDIFKDAEKNHVVHAGPDENDGQTFVHAGFGNGFGSLPDFAGFSKQNALSASLAGVEGIGL